MPAPMQPASEKTSPPSAGGIIPRPRLTAVVAANLCKRCLLIQAPAGFGKSTIVAQALSDARLPVLWYSFDDSDLSMQPLTGALAAGLQRITRLPMPGEPGEDASVPDRARYIAACAARGAPEGVHLVLDGLDRCPDGDQAAAFVQTLIDHGPHSLHLVLTTTARPPLRLTGLARAGQLARVEADALRFSPDEVRDLLAQAWRAPVSTEAVRRVVRLTGGWAAGLALFVAANPVAPGHSSSGTARPGGERYITHMPAEDQRILIAAAMLPVVDADSVVELTGRAADGSRFRAIAADCSFLRAAGSGSYTMAPSVRQQFLAIATRTWGAEVVQEWRQRSAEITRLGGRLEQALSLFLEAGDGPGIGTTLAAIGVSTLREWDAASVVPLAARLAGIEDAGPEADYLRARAGMLRGDMECCESACARGLSKISHTAGQGPLFLALSALRANALGFVADDASADLVWNDLAANLPPAPLDRGWLLLMHASYLLRTGRLRQGETQLRAALEAWGGTGPASQRGWALNRLADLETQHGRYRAALSALTDAQPLSRQAGAFQSAVNRYLFAQAHLLAGRFGEARRHAIDALGLAEQAGASFARFALAIILMDVAIGLGEVDTAREWLEQAESLAGGIKAGSGIEHSLHAARGRLALTLGMTSLALESFRAALVAPPESRAEGGWTALHAALCLLRVGEVAKAASVAADVQAQASGMDAAHLGANALLLSARTADLEGDHAAAEERLHRFWALTRLRGLARMPASDTALLEWARGHGMRGGGLLIVAGEEATAEGRYEPESPAVPRLEIRTFGPLCLVMDGIVVPEQAWRANLKGKRLFELLLAARSGQVSIDDAVEYLWPTAPFDKGRHRLHAAVTRLRATLQAMGVGGLITVRHEHSFYRLSLPPEVHVDHRDFQTLADRGLAEFRKGHHEPACQSLRQAVMLCAGTFLEDAAFERFAELRRHQLSELYGEVLRALATSPDTPRPEALQWWERALDHDPYDDDAYRGAIEACRGLGLQGKAAALVAAMRQHIVEELGVPLPDWAGESGTAHDASCR